MYTLPGYLFIKLLFIELNTVNTHLKLLIKTKDLKTVCKSCFIKINFKTRQDTIIKTHHQQEAVNVSHFCFVYKTNTLIKLFSYTNPEKGFVQDLSQYE